MCRRIPLGLAEPVVTDRFRMHGISSLAIAAITAITIASPLCLGLPGRDHPILGPSMLLLWLIVCCSGACACIAPRPYRVWVERRYATMAPPTGALRPKTQRASP